MIKAVIIEDELNNQELLETMLHDYCENIMVIGKAESVSAGISIIKNTKPDVIFLDIEIDEGNGFDILAAFAHPRFKTIFITGYAHYAIKAIKFAALDYLLKPLNLEELQLSINKINPEIQEYGDNYKMLKERISDPSEKADQLLLPHNNAYSLVKFKEILYLKALQSYVEIFLVSGKKIIGSNNLTYYADLLPDDIFFRTHKSYIANINHLKSIDQGRGGYITLQNEQKIPISYRRKSIFYRHVRSKSQS